MYDQGRLGAPRAKQARGPGREGNHDSHTRHTFSFGEYYDPGHMGFGSLRVINEDRIQPRGGFPSHPHRDMEIISFLAGGALEHRDSMGNGSVIRAGEVQRMTAGTGITHSEFNPSAEETTHLIQIWILPERKGLEPGYEQKDFRVALSAGLVRIASRDGREGSVTIHRDASVWAGRLAAGRRWVQVIAGSVAVNGQKLEAGDGAGLEDEARVELDAREDSDVLVFDV